MFGTIFGIGETLQKELNTVANCVYLLKSRPVAVYRTFIKTIFVSVSNSTDVVSCDQIYCAPLTRHDGN